ncbi:hypothetical protein TGVAND_282070 [Toxoplasma gondii VAND]|uniref:Uncharacterized protein n=1 Tax=Toxoplasma gondii VAND TaxID=933077 RepID=A0A086PIQ6_TOXGO|nr:hypothetical protein TGVAND_282070 [Toxoplasma gondii VAND]
MSCQAGPKDQAKQRSSSMEAYWSGATEAQFQLQRGEGLGYNSSGRVVAQMNGLAGSSAVPSGPSVSSQNAETKVPSWTNPSSMGPVFHSNPPTDMTGSAPSGTQNPVTPLFSVAQTQHGQPVQLNSATRLISQDHTSVSFAATPTFPGNSRYASTVSDTFQASSSFEGTRISSVSGHGISTGENHTAQQQLQQLPGLRASGSPAAENSRKMSNLSFTDKRSSVPGEYPSSDESASCTKTPGEAKRTSVDCSLESNVNSQRTVVSDVSSQPRHPEGSGRRSRKPTCFDLLYNDALVRRARKQREEEALRSKPSNGQKQTPQQWEQRWSLMVKRHQEKLQTNENLRRKLDISKLEDERRECTFKPVTRSSRKPLAQQRSCLIKMKQLADKQKDLINAVCVLHQEERDIDDLIAKELQADIACASESGNNDEIHKVLDFYRHLRAEETSRLRSLKLDLVSQVSRLEQQYKRTAAAVNLVESDIAETVGFDLKLAEQLNDEIRQDIDAANSLRLGARFRSILEAVTTGQPLFPPNERGVSLLYDGADAAYSRRQSKGPDLASRSASRHRFSIRGDSFSRGLEQRQRSPALSRRGASTRRVSRQASQLHMHSSRSCSPGPSGPANGGVRRSTFGGDAPSGFAKPLQQSMPSPQVSPRFLGFQRPASPALRAVSALYPSPELRSSSNSSGKNSAGRCISGFGALTPSDPAGIHHPCDSYPQNNQSPSKSFQMSGGFGAVIENEGLAFNSSGEGKPLDVASPAGASPRMLTSWQKEKAKHEMRQRLPSRHGSDGLWSAPLTSHRGSFNASRGFIDRDEGPSRVPSSRGATPRKAPQHPAAGLASTRNAFQSVSGYSLMHPPMMTQTPQTLGPVSSPVAKRQAGQALGNVAASPRFAGTWNGQLSGQQVGDPGVMASNGGNPALIDTLPNTQNDATLHSMHGGGAGYMKAMAFMSNHPGNMSNNAANAVASAGNMSNNARGAVVAPSGTVQAFHQSCSVRPLGGAQLRTVIGNAFPCARAPNAMAETPGFPARMPVGFVQDKAPPMSAQPNYPMVAFQGAPMPVQGVGSFTPPSPRNLPYPVLAETQAILQKGVVQAESDKTGTSVSVQGNGSPAPFPTQTAVKQPLAGPQAPVLGAPTPNLPRLAGGAVLKLANNGHVAFVDFAATAKQLQRGGMASAR